MFRRKFLVVAPDNIDLPKTDIEIRQLRRYHDAKVLSGTVREQDIIEALESDDFNGIWFITHSSSEGILLSDGMLSPDAPAQYAKSYPLELIVFNTCESEEIALRVNEQAQIDVVCTISEINNVDAIRFGQLLAKEISYYEDVGEAFSEVATDGGDYRFYSAQSTVRGRDVSMTAKFATLERLVVGEYGRGGILQRIEAIEQYLPYMSSLPKVVQYLPILDKIASSIEGTKTISTQTFNQISLIVIVVIIVLAAFAWQGANGG